MDSSDFISCIGKAEDAPEVQSLLAFVGATKKLKMPKDDIDVRHVLHGLGLSLVFKPEGPRSSRLIFNAVQFLSAAEEGFTTFAGALPAHLEFSDAQAQAHAKLGSPLISKPKLRRDIWQLGELRLAVKYAKDAPHHIALVTVHVPLED